MSKSEVLRARVTLEELEILKDLVERTGWNRSRIMRALIRNATLAPQPAPVPSPLNPKGTDETPAGSENDNSEHGGQHDKPYSHSIQH